MKNLMINSNFFHLSKRKGILLLLLSFYLSITPGLTAENIRTKPFLEWNEFPSLPLDIAGHFAGISNNVIIVAGGARFPVPKSQGGEKVWIDTCFVFLPGKSKWEGRYKLDQPIGYGSTISDDEELICIGGSNEGKHFSGVFTLRWINDSIQRTDLPSLPEPCAFHSSTLMDGIIYVAGGQSSPQATEALHNFWMLDRSKPNSQWEKLPPWPGPSRINPVAIAQDGFVYIISGAELFQGRDGNIGRRYLKDVYRFNPDIGWKKMQDLPSPVVAAPATKFKQSHILIFGGNDGEYSRKKLKPGEHHPGFSRKILAYHTITDTWTNIGQLPVGLVTTDAIVWGDTILIAGGENYPGYRSAQVLKGTTLARESSSSIIDFIAIVLYFLCLIVIGIVFSRREKTTDDFFIAGRRIPWWAAGISIFATQLSAITFMAVPAKAFTTDWVYFIGYVCIVLVAPVVIYFYLPFFRRLDARTAYEYLEKRFNLSVRLFGSLTYTLMHLGRMTIIIFLPCIALSMVTGINITTCILLMGGLCIIYTVLGGIEAVIWSDVIQVVILLGGAILSLIIIIGKLDNGISDLFSIGLSDNKFNVFNWTWDITTTAVWVVFFGYMINILIPYTSDQTVIQRYMTTKNEKKAVLAIWTNAAMAIPSAIIFLGLGTALYCYYKTFPGYLDPSLDADAIFPLFISQNLPAGIAGLVIASLFASAMSSLDSSMNSITAVIVTDFYQRFKPNTSQKNDLKLARWITGMVGVLGTCSALLLTRYEIRSLWDLFIQIMSLFGGTLAGLFALGIFTRRANGKGALIGALCGGMLQFFVQGNTQIHFFLYGAVGFLTCIIVGYFSSLLLPSEKVNNMGLTIYTIRNIKEKNQS